MIVTGGTVFIRQCDKLPQITLRSANVVMELPEPATMADFTVFLAQHVGRESDVRYCSFYTLESWAQIQAREQLQVAKVDARQDQAAPGWAKRTWSRIVGTMG